MSGRSFRLENFMGFAADDLSGTPEPVWVELRDICLAFAGVTPGQLPKFPEMRL